jgi:DNA-binding IclR family transcriptional regulator
VTATDGAQPVASGRVQSVERAMAILTAVATSPTGLTASEISERLHLNKPTTYHLLRTLQRGAYLFRGGDHRYRLDFRIGTLAEGFERQLSFEESLAEYVRRLADTTEEQAHLAVRRGSTLVLLKTVPGRHAIQAAPQFAGVLADIHSRASGKVAMAWAPDDIRETFVKTYPLRRLTPTTITKRSALHEELERVVRDGYAMSNEECDPGIVSIAAPIDRGLSPFILGLSAPRTRTDAHLDRYLTALLGTVEAASVESPLAT